MTTDVHTRHGIAAAARQYLMIVDGDVSWQQPLPSDGTLVIGRVPACEVQLSDTSVSRQHARLELAAGHATVIDLGSQNGTLVNNQRVARRELVGGDVLTIGSAILVFHGPLVLPAAASTVLASELRTVVAREIDRVIEFGRELAVLHVTGIEGRDAVEQALMAHARKVDVLAWDGPGTLEMALPEPGPETLDQLVAALIAAAPTARLGVAITPRDGCDADGLIGGARAAAAMASPGTLRAAAGTARTLTLGDREVLIADPAMARVYALVERLAPADLPTLVFGETGSGKELVAAAMHHLSSRRDQPRVAINCAALPESLVESELFGHERGAFSGAVATKPGIFEQARGGTVFLDEIGELSLAVQAKLLRVLETKRVMRLGDVRELAVDFRLVSATNRDLKEASKRGQFRQDLYFRLSGATVWIPPLRDRPREIPILAQRFVADACARAQRPALALATSAIQRLATHTWPGNVRELKNVCDYLAATVREPRIEEWHLDDLALASEQEAVVPAAAAAEAPNGGFRSLSDEVEALEKQRIAEALRASAGNQTRAARSISVPLRTFLTKMKRYGISG